MDVTRRKRSNTPDPSVYAPKRWTRLGTDELAMNLSGGKKPTSKEELDTAFRELLGDDSPAPDPTEIERRKAFNEHLDEELRHEQEDDE